MARGVEWSDIEKRLPVEPSVDVRQFVCSAVPKREESITSVFCALDATEAVSRTSKIAVRIEP